MPVCIIFTNATRESLLYPNLFQKLFKMIYNMMLL